MGELARRIDLCFGPDHCRRKAVIILQSRDWLDWGGVSMKLHSVLVFFTFASGAALAGDVNLGDGQSVVVSCNGGSSLPPPTDFRDEVDSSCLAKVYPKNTLKEMDASKAFGLISAAIAQCRGFVPSHSSCVKMAAESNSTCVATVQAATFFDGLDSSPEFIGPVQAACKTIVTRCRI